jgi:putative redox protein
MSNDEKEALEQSLGRYKEKIAPVNRATLTWEKELIFVGTTQEGYDIEFDAQMQQGCKPTDALLLALAGCMGIDVVMFLQKMRMKISSFKMDLTGERNPTPPQYYKSVEMVMHIAGEGLDTKKIDRAVSLSQEKYCSVYNSLRKDMVVKVSYVLQQ